MTTAFDPQVLAASSWSGLSEVGAMADAGAMLEQGARKGVWPSSLRFDSLHTGSGLKAPGRAVVATYPLHGERCLSTVGKRYSITTPEQWSTLVHAAVAAGAQPTATLATKGGNVILAGFQVGAANGLRTQLIIADSFDGSRRLTCGFTSIRARCANQMSAILREDGEGMAQLRHTASLETKVNVLAGAIADAVKQGDQVRAAYHRAESTRLSRAQADAIFDRLFPAAPEGSSVAAVTKADNTRADARRAMADDVNYAGCTLATLWNGATYLVDRTADGAARPTRGGDALDSLLFGSRGERVAEIQTIVELVMRDGSIQSVAAPDALAMGVEPRQVGRAVLDSMLADLS